MFTGHLMQLPSYVVQMCRPPTLLCSTSLYPVVFFYLTFLLYSILLPTLLPTLLHSTPPTQLYSTPPARVHQHYSTQRDSTNTKSLLFSTPSTRLDATNTTLLYSTSSTPSTQLHSLAWGRYTVWLFSETTQFIFLALCTVLVIRSITFCMT